MKKVILILGANTPHDYRIAHNENNLVIILSYHKTEYEFLDHIIKSKSVDLMCVVTRFNDIGNAGNQITYLCQLLSLCKRIVDKNYSSPEEDLRKELTEKYCDFPGEQMKKELIEDLERLETPILVMDNFFDEGLFI